MKLDPQQAPLYGKCLITVQLCDKELVEDKDGVEFFLLFTGTTQRHLTSAQRSSHDTLQVLCPSHDCSEVVQVTLCTADPRAPLAPVAHVSEMDFSFVQDLSFDMAQFLVSTAGRPDGLDGALLLDECRIPLQECNRLDESLALALNHLTLPHGWSLLGSSHLNSSEPQPQETLLHFAARRGLRRVTKFLLQQPGAKLALRLTNKQGHTPNCIAKHRGHTQLLELLTQAETESNTERGPDSVNQVSADARIDCHHPRLNTHTLTVGIVPGTEPPTLQKAVEHLRHLICHLHSKGVPSLQLQSESLHTAQECCDSLETEGACSELLQQPECLDTRVPGCEKENTSVDLEEPSSGSLVGFPPPVYGDPQENGLCPEGNSVRFSSFNNADYGEPDPEKREEGGEVVREEAGIADSKPVCDRSDTGQRQPEGESLALGAPLSCGEEPKKTTGGDVICVTQGAVEGTEQPGQEGEHNTAERAGTHTEPREPATINGERQILNMGQTQSFENEDSESSGMDIVECSHGMGTEKAESDGFIDSINRPAEVPNPPLVDNGDEMQEIMSDVLSLCPAKVGLPEIELLSDTNNLGQTQETAAMDYSLQQQCDCPGVSSQSISVAGDRFGDWTVNETTLACAVAACDAEDSLPGPADLKARCPWPDSDSNHLPSPITITVTGTTMELDSGTAQGVSSDEEESFRSISSSSTETFHLTEDSQSLGDNVAEDYLEPNEKRDPSPASDCESPLEQIGDLQTVTDSAEASLTSPTSPNTMEPSCPEQTPEALGQTSMEMMEDATDGQGVTLANESDLNVGTTEGNFCSTVTKGFLCTSEERARCESGPLASTEITVPEPTATSFSAQEASGEQSTELNQKFILLQLSGYTSDTIVNKIPTDVIVDEVPATSETQPVTEEVLDHFTPPSEGVASTSAESSETASAFADDLTLPSHGEVKSDKPAFEDLLPALVETHESLSPHGNGVLEVEAPVAEQHADGTGAQTPEHMPVIHRDKEAVYPLALGSSPTVSRPRSECSDLPQASVCPGVSSTGSTNHRDSGSDTESFFSTDIGEDCVFRKGDEPLTGSDSTSEVSVSCSSTDDTASVALASSSPESCVEGQGRSWSPEGSTKTRASSAGGEAAAVGAGCMEGTDEEAKDRLTEVPPRSALRKPSIRSLSPFRRHSWGPGRNSEGEPVMNHRSSARRSGKPSFHRRSYSLEGLSGERDSVQMPSASGCATKDTRHVVHHVREERDSLLSLTEEREPQLGEHSGLDGQKSRRFRPLRHSCPPMTLPLTKSVSMLAISQRDTDAIGSVPRKRRISFSFSLSPILTRSKTNFFSADSSSSDDEDEDNLSMRSFSSTSGSLAYSISEEEPGPLKSDTEGKSGTKVSRTFSYLRSKMYKKNRERDREKRGEKDKEGKEKEKKTVNGHLFTTVSSAHVGQCLQCSKAINTKEAFLCQNCNAYVHKGCREILPACIRVKIRIPKQQFTVPDSNTLPVVTMRNKPTGMRDRPWSAILTPEDHSLINPSRRHTSIMPFHSGNLSKSISISNIAGPVFDDMPIKGLRYLSQSTDSLNRTTNLVNESTESLTDEGTEMMDSQLMGEFESDVKDLEADSWSITVDKKYLKQFKKDLIKRQDVIYELIQTEMHHVRTLRIMSEVYSKGLQKEVALEGQTVERVFPVLDELLDLHTQFFTRLLEKKRESQLEGSEDGFTINRIGDILVNQFSGSNAESMKRVYGKFCSRHNEAVSFYKELLTKDKRFQAFVKRKMSSSIVRRLGIPECILLVTQRITKYPVLMQRILQHTKENEEDHEELSEALRMVKEVLAVVDNKVNEHEKKRRLKDIYSRTDSKSIMRMKSGQMFAREDLMRGRRLLHDGPLQLKNAQGRLKDVQAMLLSDVFVFLQEKDQKYVFASLDQRSTVISLQKLIVREVANEERGLFLITAGIEKPEMVEVLASTKEERNNWMQLIQDAMHSIEKDEDEGIPSETEEDKRHLETKAKEMRDMLRKKDEQIVALLEEKMKVFRDMCEFGGSTPDEQAASSSLSSIGRGLFRAGSQDLPKGEPIMKDALQEVETLQTLVNGSLGGAVGQQVACGAQETAAVAGGGGGGGGVVGPVCLPRRAETFGGFDSHQMNISKNGDKDEGEDTADLRRTESDGVLKKGGNANLLLLLKRNSEVLHSVTHLHDLLNSLQAVVVQQDTFIEDQRQALGERSSSSTLSSLRPSSRPNSLIEQEKQRSLEKHRQEMASLHRQQAAYADEKRRKEREWELREKQLTDKEVLLNVQEEETSRRGKGLEEERLELQNRKEEYQRDLERLRDAQRKLDRDREQLQREMERIEQLRLAERRMERTPSSTSDDSLQFLSTLSLEQPVEAELSSSPRRNSLSRLEACEMKPRGKNLNPFSTNSSMKSCQPTDSHSQIPNRLLQLARSKDKKDKKKKKGKGESSHSTDPQPFPESPIEGEIFFC